MSINSEKENENNFTNVYCRFRPLTKKELEFSFEQISPKEPEEILNLNTSKEKNIYSFNFDQIYPSKTNQRDIYEKCVKKTVEKFLLGYNCAIITHGQNDTGKSYTMIGKIEDNNLKGIIPRVMKDVFEFIFDNDNLEFIVKVSMVDIYNDKVRDLINYNYANIIKDKEFNQDENILDEIYEKYVSNENEVLKILEKGINNKAKFDYNINLDGKFSKSNFMLILKLIQNNKKEGFFTKSELIFFDSSGEENLFPLSQKESEAQSPLSILFQKIFGGNYITNLIITCSSSIFNQENTLKYLRLGEKMKKIKNKARINKELSYKKLKEKLTNYELKIKQLEIKSSFKIDELKKSKDNLSFEEIFKMIVNLIENENNLGNKEDILKNIYGLKDKYNSKIENLNQKIKELEEKIKINNEIKNKLHKNLIVQQTQNIKNNSIFNECLEFISKLKKLKEINAEQIIFLEKKFQNFDKMNNLDSEIININPSIKKDINLFTQLISEKNVQITYKNDYNKFNKSEQYSQNEINNKSEMSKFEIDKEKDIKYLSLCLEENKQIILELKKEIITLQNKNKILENNALLNERKIRDKNMILENNILELKKKYEESQIKRLILEDKCRQLNSIFLNKKMNLINIKDESINKSIGTPKNIVKITTKIEEN